MRVKILRAMHVTGMAVIFLGLAAGFVVYLKVGEELGALYGVSAFFAALAAGAVLSVTSRILEARK